MQNYLILSDNDFIDQYETYIYVQLIGNLISFVFVSFVVFLCFL